jgi:CTD small phosphatase-like protein 2
MIRGTLNIRSFTPSRPTTPGTSSTAHLEFTPTEQKALYKSSSVSSLNPSRGIQPKKAEATRSLSKLMSSTSAGLRPFEKPVSSLVFRCDDNYSDRLKECVASVREKLDNISKRYGVNQAPERPYTTVEPSGRPLTPKAKSPDDILKEFVTSMTPKPVISKTQTYTKPANGGLKAPKSSDAAYNDHLYQTFLALKFVRNLPEPDMSQLSGRRLHLTKRPAYMNKKTVIFDLDETLIHCLDESHRANADAVIPIKFPTGEIINAYIKIRPYARECLREVNKDFEVIVFTASHKCYADAVLDYLDPSNDLIHHRLYRENCMNIQGVFIKDLRILSNRRLEETVLVDNAAYSFAYQIDNGIPIISWYEDPKDKELYSLINYLRSLINAYDVREVNRQTFSLRTFYDDYAREFLTSGVRRV